MISYGSASGPVPPVHIAMLADKRSLKVTRPSLFTHLSLPGVAQEMAGALFEKVTSGAVQIRVDQRFALDAIAEAHRLLEGRHTTGSTILIP